jgi:hypothetical protein
VTVCEPIGAKFPGKTKEELLAIWNSLPKE